MDRKDGMGQARKAAWEVFGRKHWAWFVYGPAAIKVVAVLALLGGIAWGGVWVVSHSGPVLSWLGSVLIPAGAIALVTSLYGIACVVAWRLWCWDLRSYGVGHRWFATGCISFGLVVGLVYGVLS